MSIMGHLRSLPHSISSSLQNTSSEHWPEPWERNEVPWCYTQVIKAPTQKRTSSLLFTFHWPKQVRWRTLTSTWWELKVLLGEKLGFGEEWNILQLRLKDGHCLSPFYSPPLLYRETQSRSPVISFICTLLGRPMNTFRHVLLTLGFQLDLC